MREIKNRLIMASIATVIAAGFAIAAGKSDSKLTSDDTDFLKKAAKGGMAEVELGRLALQKSSNSQVKQFANMMIRDHSKANRELLALAASKGVDLPKSKELGDDVNALHLKMLSGNSFDEAYAKAMIEDHKEDVADFQKESQSASDPEVRHFAQKMLPTLQTHLSKAQGLQPGM